MVGRFLIVVMILSALQAGCSREPITMWHPVNQKSVRCADERCALQYEAAGYLRVPKETK